jgi:hypothetical protein
VIVLCAAACTTTPGLSATPGFKPDAAAAGSSCPSGYYLCQRMCCPTGTTCGASGCEYPYSTAHLYVYLCPSFNTGNCKATFFALDQTCSPIESAQPGTCYDTKLEVAAGKTYGLASCTACGTNCGSPASVRTPPGFIEPKYYPGSTWFCGTPCEAPRDCGGRPSGDAGAAAAPTCSSTDCWLNALSIRDNAVEVTRVVIKPIGAPAAATTSDPSTPRITGLNGTSIAPSQPSASMSLSPLLRTTDTAQLDYDFNDPTGCSPGTCIRMARCPPNVQCNLGTSVCTHAKRDGALVGSVIRTLGFKAEPADPATVTALPLQFQLIAGPKDPMTGSCKDPIDDSDPSNPMLTPDALISDPIEVDAIIVGPAAPGGVGVPPPAPDGGTRGGGGGSGSGGTCTLPSQCSSDADCSRLGAAHCDPANGARCGTDGLCHCCLALCGSSGGACSCISCASGCGADQTCIGSVCAFKVGGHPCD